MNPFGDCTLQDFAQYKLNHLLFTSNHPPRVLLGQLADSISLFLRDYTTVSNSIFSFQAINHIGVVGFIH